MTRTLTLARTIRCSAVLGHGRVLHDRCATYLLDTDLEDDHAIRRHLHRFTTPRRGSGGRLVWLLDELGVQL